VGEYYKQKVGEKYIERIQYVGQCSAQQREEDNEWSAERVVRQRLRRQTAQNLDNPSRKSLGVYERQPLMVEGRCYSAAAASAVAAAAADDQQLITV